MKIVIFGEVCKDEFIYCDCNRLNPEAPTPLVKPKYTKTFSGMAGNVYKNIRSLDVYCKHIYQYERIIKERYVDDKSNYILLRVDYEDIVSPLELIELDQIDFNEFDAVIISDYNKGFLTTGIIQEIIERGKLVFIDTKKPIGSWIKGADFIKINQVEYNNLLNNRDVINDINHKLIVTLGSEGCLFNNKRYETKTVDVMDVVGAGDSFLSGLVCAYLKMGDIEKSIQFANFCATYVVQKRGISDLEEINKFYNKL